MTTSQVSSRTRTTMPHRSRAGTITWFVESVICGVSHVDRTAKESDQPLDGGGLCGHELSGAETTSAGLLGQLASGKHERLFDEIVRQVERLIRSLCEVPAVSEEVVEPDLQSIGAGGSPERAVVGALEDSGPAEGYLQRGRGVAVGADRVAFHMIGARPGRRRLVGE